MDRRPVPMDEPVLSIRRGRARRSGRVEAEDAPEPPLMGRRVSLLDLKADVVDHVRYRMRRIASPITISIPTATIIPV
jgi:hypothetical protein